MNNKPNRFMSFEILISIFVIVAFFLPWIHFGFVKVTGWEIPDLNKTVTQVSNVFSKNKDSLYTSYAIFTVPALGALVVLLRILLAKTISRIVLFVNSLLGGLLSVYMLFKLPKIGYGVYVLLIASAIGLIYFVLSRKKKADNNNNIEPADIPSENNPIL